MKKRNVQTLQLNKKQVAILQINSLKGGTLGLSLGGCTRNTVPREKGGLGCHAN